jgi:hypothetical protein
MATAALDDYYLYRKTTSTDLIALVSPTTLLGNAANAVSALTNIGFTFNFNNTDYTQFSVSSQGYVELGAASSFYWEPSNITDVNTQVLLCPWWDDLRTSTDGIRYELFGSGPDRYLVIEFHSRAYYSYTLETIRHQVVLYETSNNVEFRYEYSNPFSGVVGNSAVIGCKVDTTSVVDGRFRDFFGTNGVAESNPNGGWSVVEAGIPNHSLDCNEGNDYPGDPTNTEEGAIFYFLFSPAAEAAGGGGGGVPVFGTDQGSKFNVNPEGSSGGPLINRFGSINSNYGKSGNIEQIPFTLQQPGVFSIKRRSIAYKAIRGDSNE